MSGRITSFVLSAVLLMAVACRSYPANYWEYYENLNGEAVSAYAAVSGNTIFDFIPFEIEHRMELGRYFASASLRLTRAGGDYGSRSDLSREENLDMVKHITFIYNQRPDFKLFTSYYTPYKSIIKIKDDYATELTRKRDTFSLGTISVIGKNTVAVSLDGNYSLYERSETIPGTENRIDTRHRALGLSNRFLVNLFVNRRSSMFFGFKSPVYWQQKLGESFADRFLYFNGREVNAGFSYESRMWFGRYSATYQEFEKVEVKKESEGWQEGDSRWSMETSELGHPWLIEHRLMGGRKISRHVKIALDYKLTPSYFNKELSGMTEIGSFRHSLGAFIGYTYDRMIWNFYVANSSLFSPKALGVTSFQLDLAFSF